MDAKKTGTKRKRKSGTSAAVGATTNSAPPSPVSSGSVGPKTVVNRVKGGLIERPIVYGSIAWWLGKQAEESKTHRWTCFVRGPHNEDLSYFIKKVVFSLHTSFQNPVRVVERPPFEVTEHGWGEFEIAIRIYFIDPLEKPVDLYHALQLYPSDGQAAMSTKKPVIKEVYDEIVFNDPTDYFYRILKENQLTSAGTSPHPQSFARTAEQTPQQTQKEMKDLDEIARVRSKIRDEIIKARDAYDAYDAECRELKEQIKELTETVEEAYRKHQQGQTYNHHHHRYQTVGSESLHIHTQNE